MSNKDIFNKANKIHRNCFNILNSLREDDDPRTIEAIRKEALSELDDLFCCVEDLYEGVNQREDTISQLEDTISVITQRADARDLFCWRNTEHILIPTHNVQHLDVVMSNGDDTLGLKFSGYNVDKDAYIFKIVDEKKWIFYKLKYSF